MSACGCRKNGKPTPDSIINTRRRSPDGMRSGALNFEVPGSDRASHGTRAADTLQIHTRTNPAFNQAGIGFPSANSSWWHAMKRGVTVFTRQMDPVINTQSQGFKNNIGVNASQMARNVTVVPHSKGYGGILPLSQQPKINKPLPY